MFRFGHYEVLENSDGSPCELGRGAMGITYKATDTALHRDVALKVINPDNLTGDAARQRFLREARAAAQLKHPNVASVYHLGEEGGTHFYAMEFIEGETLESLIQRSGPLTCGFALDITAQVAEALAAAHGANLVHRDIKPANLMIVRDANGRATVKVIDFGLAKSAVHSGQDDATITMGGFVGTPHFASPEQLEEKEIDIRSDIYSLGATLWHMLTGRTLFTGSLVRVMIGQISENPLFEQLAAPPEMIELLRTMLAKDPADRPQTPADLLALVHQTQQTVDPDLVCGASELHGETWTGFTLQELLRVRRELPVPEVLVLLRRLAETLDSIGPLGVNAVDLRIHSVGVDFVRPPTASAQDSMMLSIAEWPAFNIKFRNIDNASSGSAPLETTSAEETLLEPVAANPHGNDVQRLAGLVYELLGGKARSTSDFAPLAALSEGGNAVLKAALRETPRNSYPTGTEFCAALSSAEKGETPPPVRMTSRNPARTAPLELVRSEAPETFQPPGEPQELAIVHAPKKRHPLRALLLLLALAGAAVTGFVWFRHGQPRTLSEVKQAFADEWASLTQSAPTTAGDKKTNPTPKPSDNSKLAGGPAHPTPAPATPTPVPTPPPLTREQKLKLALDEKARFESTGDWVNALIASVKLAKGYPEYDKNLTHLDEMVIKARDAGAFRGDWRAFYPTVNEASEMGSTQAMLTVGEHVRKNQPERALILFRASAEKGIAQSMVELGSVYLHGEGVVADPKEAERWFVKASDANEPAGTCFLAEAYLTGRGVKQDSVKAVQLFQDAAGHRSGEAKNILGKIYLYGLLGFPANKLNAGELFRQAKDLNCAEAYYNLGMINLGSHSLLANPGRAPVLFKRGAEMGNALCMYYYGKCLEEGTGVPVAASEATQWYAKAADKLKKEADEGSRAAILTYAQALEGGKGVDLNPTGSSHYYLRAAVLGDPIAQKWCVDHKVLFHPNVMYPGQGILFLPHNLMSKEAATPAPKTP